MKRLAEALEKTKSTRSRIGKEETLGAAFAAIARDPDDADGVALSLSARLAVGRALPVGDARPVGVGHTLIFEVALAQTGWSKEIVWACARRCGELGEAFGLLVARIEGAHERPGVALRELAAMFDALASSGNRTAKRRRLDEVFARATPLETKYLAKTMLGSMRVGAQAGVVEGAIARGFGRPIEAVRAAAALVTDPGALIVLARDDRLGDAHVEVGRPIAYMLATPLETIASTIDPAVHVSEDKIDGVRAQVHKLGGDVSIFARGLERVTDAYPEIVEAFQFVRGPIALDGELVAVTESGRPRPFQALQARLRRNAPSRALLAETPVAFIAYDLLVDEQGELLGLPFSERRARLEAFADSRGPRTHFFLNEARPLQPDKPLVDQLDVEFDEARARGHEGVVLKRVDAQYDAGRRGQAWIKVKRAFATLDCVITVAESGSGKRAGVLSDYTFAVWKGDELVNVGKAYSGLTDEEIDTMTRKLERLTIERYGGARAVKPAIVLEVGFDGIQKSTRHKSGYALRFPRILRIRDDKQPHEADTIETVEALFRSQLETGHREDEAPRTRETKKRKALDVPKSQLSLFGDDVKKR